MNGIMKSALFTDFYELTMAQGYWKQGTNDHRVAFDYFFRRQPFSGGYSVFAGMGTLLEALEDFHYSQDDIAYLESLGIFDAGFLDYLSGFRFRGDILSVKEGEIVFPQEPLVRVEGDLVQAQIVEGLVLNTLNFQSLIATKSARIWLASGRGKIMEFGLRRAQGADGAISAARAAFIGGAYGSSNTLAGKLFGMPVLGTMAHSWVMSFPSELEAFRAYAEIYPASAVFLIDTYNTLESGILNAITVGKELKAQGYTFGVRLDSGDIDYLTRKVREKLDDAGFKDAWIVVSNELDEFIIEHLVASHAPIDMWGVGTKLITGGDDAAFTGVYKLAAMKSGATEKAVMKVSENPEKSTNPGRKNLFRLYDENDTARLDLITLADEEPRAGTEIVANHPLGDYRRLSIVPARVEPLLSAMMEKGVKVPGQPILKASQEYMDGRLKSFDTTYLRQLNPHVYKVSMSTKLRDLKLSLIKKYLKTK
ncbi:MAG TPA: nicotinate phosphoribosyltransferase [Spirochaetaceae bacterium]|nr:nicotinate phosphoribosyltransferase [Spirochaetaceae bacterium]